MNDHPPVYYFVGRQSRGPEVKFSGAPPLFADEPPIERTRKKGTGVHRLLVGCLCLVTLGTVMTCAVLRGMEFNDGPLLYRGELARVEDLPKTGNQEGDMWKVGAHNWIWRKATWIDP